MPPPRIAEGLRPRRLLFPWFEEARNWVSIVAHLACGATAAAAYKLLRSYWATREPAAA